MRLLLIAGLLLLPLGCTKQVDLAKQSLESDITLQNRTLTYRAVENYPGQVVCGQFSKRKKPEDKNFKPFIYRLEETDIQPSREDVAIFCSPDPVKSLYDITGINYTGNAIPTLYRIRDDYIALAAALADYESDNFTFPKSDQGLQALVHQSKIVPVPPRFKDGGYLSELPLDPWNKPYLYTGPGLGGGVKGSYDITTLGADSKKGGTDGNADFKYTQLKYLLHLELL